MMYLVEPDDVSVIGDIEDMQSEAKSSLGNDFEAMAKEADKGMSVETPVQGGSGIIGGKVEEGSGD